MGCMLIDSNFHSMAAILRKNGYDVKEPMVGRGETVEETKAEEASKAGWSDGESVLCDMRGT